jgi:hypothetical protein
LLRNVVWWGVRALSTLAVVAGSAAAIAGPPFVTDDPEPTDPGRWEIYTFVAGTVTAGETDSQAGFDLNYGAARDLQLTAVIPLDYRRAARTDAGLGTIELAAKYRFMHQSDGSPLPDVAFFPRLIAPTAGRTFDTGRLRVFLPLWAQKDAGKWSLFGGGGYTINPGPGQRGFWLEGIGLSRSLGDRLSVGAEVFHQSRDADDTRPFTGVNVGALYRLSRHWSLIGAAGPGIENARQQGQGTFYVALKADY